MASDREAIIRRWMLEIVSDGGIERFDHLHVDDINAGWKDPTSWVSGGLTAYGLALEMRRELDLDVTVALSFGLVDAQDDSRDVFETQEQFEKQFDWSPPSLYLFKVGDQQHLSGTVRVDPCQRLFFPTCLKIPSPFCYSGSRKTAANDAQCLSKHSWRESPLHQQTVTRFPRLRAAILS